MPVLLERAARARLPQARANSSQGDDRSLRLALVNNMPDAALESTERQFVALLDAAAGDIPVRLELFSIAEVARSDTARAHLAGRYCDLGEIWNAHFDGIIVTGTEPRAPSLQDEPYWQTLAKLFDWAEANSVSSVWSCLAAHAAVLHKDGMVRRALADKCFGVYDCVRTSEHPLTAGMPRAVAVPHSRWNELPEEVLRAAGYIILTCSPAAGVDAFAKPGKGLALFFQGHPEYDDRALFREYRRDVARYLRGERQTYPTLPFGYFDENAIDAAAGFQALAALHGREDVMGRFPSAALESGLRRTGGSPAARIHANWISQLWSYKTRRVRGLTSLTLPAVSVSERASPLAK